MTCPLPNLPTVLYHTTCRGHNGAVNLLSTYMFTLRLQPSQGLFGGLGKNCQVRNLGASRPAAAATKQGVQGRGARQILALNVPIHRWLHREPPTDACTGRCCCWYIPCACLLWKLFSAGQAIAAGWALSAVVHADSGRIGRQSQLQICGGKSSHQ